MARKREWLKFWVPIGVGIAVCGAALNWPDLGWELIAIGVVIIVASLVHQVLSLLPAILSGFFGGAIVWGIFWILPSWRDEKLPGFSFVTTINIQDAMKYSDKYVFQF